MFMACVLGFSMMPVTALAEEADAVTEQEVRNEENTMEDDIEGTNGEDISGGDAANKDVFKTDTVDGNTVSGETAAIQALNDALPVAMAAGNGGHTSHPVCGDVDCTDSSHALPDNVTWQEVSGLSDTMPAGCYYLTADVTLTESWAPASGTVLCLNGHSITMNADAGVITVADNSKTFTLCDCNGSGEGNGKITHGMNGGTKYSGRGVSVIWATFNMYGGTICGNSIAEGHGGGVYAVGTAANFNMYGGTITGNSTVEGYNGGGVYVDNYATFTMHNGEISSNSTDMDAGGVYVDTGSFTMNGGSVSGNTTEQSGSGGGVFVYKGSFTMTDGSIKDNTSRKGGGVYVEEKSNGTFTMTGGEITGNTATSPKSQIGGGVYVGEGDTFTVSGTVNIENNLDCNKKVNNVYLDDDNTLIKVAGELKGSRIGVTSWAAPNEYRLVKIATAEGYTLTDADAACFISDEGCFPFLVDGEVQLFKTLPQKHPICGIICNHADRHPDLIWKGISQLDDNAIHEDGNYYLMNSVNRDYTWTCNYNVNLCLNGNTITGAAESAVIKVAEGCTLALTDYMDTAGSITHADGTTGSGINVEGTLTLWNGTITGNTAESVGGVNLSSGGTFIMKGGSVTGNSTTGDTGCGGVYAAEGSNFTVSGTAQVQGNWKNGTESNVCLPGNMSITIGEGLAESARIGVSKSLPTTADRDVRIAAEAANDQLDYREIFRLDGVENPDYSVIRDSEGNLSIHRHEHNWTYQLSEDGTTVTAACEDAATCPYKGIGGSVTIKAPGENTLTYDGKGKAATLEGSFITGVDTSITYRKGNHLLAAGELPTDAGTYTAEITFGDDTVEAAAGVTYTIKKASLTADSFTFSAPDKLIYDGSAKTATLKAVAGVTGMGTVTVKYYQGETEVAQPVNAGSYTVKASVTDGANFNAVNNLTYDTWQFTIACDNTAPSVELTGDMTYTGEQIRPDVTVRVGNTRLVRGRDYDIVYGENRNAGAGTVTITAKGNYGFATVIENFNIEKADPELHFQKPTVTITWGDTFPGNMLNRPDDITVNYTSSNEDVAKCNQNGLDICGAGTTTITASTDGTANYNAGAASYTLTVNKAGIRIASVNVNDKDYDGSTTAEIQGISFVDKKGNAVDGLGLDLGCTATGTFSDSDAGHWQVMVKVELTPDYAKKYELASNIFTSEANITAKPVYIADITATDRDYERNNTAVKITGLVFRDAAGNLVTLAEGTEYTVTGEMGDADSGNDKDVNVRVTLTGKAAHNYSLADNTTTAKVNISKVKGGALPAYNFRQKFSDHAMKTFMPDYDLPGGEEWKYSISTPKVSGNGEIGMHTIDPATGEITYQLNLGEADTTISWTVTISNPNYEDFTRELMLTLTEKDNQEALIITGDTTVVYGQTLKLNTTGGSGTGAVAYSIDRENSTGEASIDADGVLTPVRVGTITVRATKAGDDDYDAATSAVFVITITKAIPTGEPAYSIITADGRILADVGLTLTGSSLKPTDGILEWIDDADNVLPEDTKVEVNKIYKWRFRPANENYSILTGEITPYPVYSIINGANSTWTQNTDGTLAIRGNGEFSKFRNVKVDGSIVDASNYTVTEGSTIITMKADYLKTLSAGSHTFEIVWTDGSARTGFTVAKNASGNNNGGNDENDDKDNSNNGSNGNANNGDGTNGNNADRSNTARTLNGSPDTGDASGIWMTLFSVSLAGFVGMLVRRRNHK